MIAAHNQTNNNAHNGKSKMSSLKVTAISASRPITRTEAQKFLVDFLRDQQEPVVTTSPAPVGSSITMSSRSGTESGAVQQSSVLWDDLWQVATSLTETESERVLLDDLRSPATVEATRGDSVSANLDEQPDNNNTLHIRQDVKNTSSDNDKDPIVTATIVPHEMLEDRESKEIKKADKKARKEEKKRKKEEKKRKKESSKKSKRSSSSG